MGGALTGTSPKFDPPHRKLFINGLMGRVMQQEHNHLGDPTYAAYAHGCRHADCRAAFDEYKLRLAQRKLNGEFVDLRKRQNWLRIVAEEYAAQHRPVIAGELPPGAPEGNDSGHSDGEAVAAQEPQTPPAEGTGEGQQNRAATEALSPADVAERMIKDAARRADARGLLSETWFVSATEVRQRFGVPLETAVLATRLVRPEYINIDASSGKLRLLKRPA